jgi:hypothetical protein
MSAAGGSPASISSRCPRSLLLDGPVRQSHGRPVPTCHIVVSHICGESALRDDLAGRFRFRFFFFFP